MAIQIAITSWPHGMPVPFLAQVAGNPGSQEGLAETPYRGRGGTMIQNPLGVGRTLVGEFSSTCKV
jgi:hypothetical protein